MLTQSGGEGSRQLFVRLGMTGACGHSRCMLAQHGHACDCVGPAWTRMGVPRYASARMDMHGHA
eukprot:366242-Chlamydomonas_euryale.AAC.1